MTTRQFLLLAFAMMLVIVVGCSGPGTPVTPLQESQKEAATSNSHVTWGLWQFIANTEAKTLEVVPLREGNFHLNALPFLEPPVLVNLTLESLAFNGNIIDTDIGLRHPFIGLTEFSGFDVCGLLISNGSVTGFTDTALRMAGANDTRLLNPDSYSRWWNPVEFPADGTMFGYKDGLLGAPDSTANFNCTLNGYKYFCDDITNPDGPLSVVTQAKRGLFSAGQKNIRHYKIELGTEGLVFNYAVDASWTFPDGPAPWSAPDSFPPEANRPEAWRVDISEVANTLYNDGTSSGGNLSLSINIYDWFNADLNLVRVESPGNFTMVENAIPTGSGAGYSTYTIDIPTATPAAGEIELLISVASDVDGWGGLLPGKPVTSYFTHTSSVSAVSPASYHWEYDTVTSFAGLAQATEFEDISPAIIEETDNDIALTWAATDTDAIFSGWDSVFMVGRSSDNGVTYGNLKYGDIASDGLWRVDRNKVAAGALDDAYAASCFLGSGSYLTRVEDGHPNWGVFISYPARDLETVVDSAGYIYNFDDSGASIKLKHSSAPNTLDPMDWQLYASYPVVSNAYVSHVRSVGLDSSDVVWLAFYNNASTTISLAHSTTAPPHELWDTSTIAYSAGAGISLVENPSLWIDNSDTFHICYTRFSSTSGKYELVYTHDDSTFSSPVEEVLIDSATPINDAHIAVGSKFGKEIITFTYENNNSVFLVTLIAGELIGAAEEVDINTDDIDPDGILDTDQCDLHMVWSTMDGTNYDIARRNAVLIED